MLPIPLRSYFVVGTLLLCIFGAIGGLMVWRAPPAGDDAFAPPPVAVAAAVARTESWDTHVEAVGTVGAVRGVDITSEESGVVTSLNFDSGDQVAAGQLLVVLNDKIEQASRQNQIAVLHLAQLVFDRDQKLLVQKTISQTQYDRSQADLAQAKAQLAEIEARLRNRSIHAPFAGTTGLRLVDIGDYVSPGTVIATLQDLSALDVDFSVPAREAAAINPGFSVEVRLADDPGEAAPATVLALDSKIDPETRNRRVRARLGKDSTLVPGSFVSVRVALPGRRAVVTVPETALTYSLQGDIVYVLETSAAGELTQAPHVVEAGETRAGRIAIIAGLEAGARVITAGQNKLYRGARVVVDEKVQL
ncbi:MAG: efflux RND transporter periplasmic adaptor subunit [Xanthomonadales bacterium]|nr:efflux RND transporter periplasmic adaptor subunit [Xanthomonadales bacterium]